MGVNELYKQMQSGQPPGVGLRVGTVEVCTGTDLQIRTDILLKAEDLRVADYLKQGWLPALAGTLKGTAVGTGNSGSDVHSTVTVPVEGTELTRKTAGLQKGDTVILWTPDGQAFFVICKVVSWT